MSTSPQHRQVRRAHAEALADGFRPSCAAMALLFAIFAVWHAVEFGFSVARVMVPLSAVTAVLAFVVYLLLRRGPMRPGWAHPVAAVLATVAYLNCVVQFALTSSEHLTVDVVLLIVTIGVCIVDPLWVAGLAGALAVSWVVVVIAYAAPGQLSGTGSNLIIGLVIAAMGNTLRRHTLARLLQAQSTLEELSRRCDLTGLLNRRGFLDAAEELMATGRLLLEVARALEDVFPNALVARLAGDEFAVVDADTGVDRDADQRRLDDRLVTTTIGHTIRVSTGTATSRSGQTLSEVLSAADTAMYIGKAAKRATRGRAASPGISASRASSGAELSGAELSGA